MTMPQRSSHHTKNSLVVSRHPPHICAAPCSMRLYVIINVDVGTFRLLCHGLGLRWRPRASEVPPGEDLAGLTTVPPPPPPPAPPAPTSAHSPRLREVIMNQIVARKSEAALTQRKARAMSSRYDIKDIRGRQGAEFWVSPCPCQGCLARPSGSSPKLTLAL
ncbi:uncharacterized protein B0I36DRAFT_326123 [Microdochium trichocladiopsis]|uniref:Uncharacterized protein n=1 Tax=Microdochium trichocladiopsis TaxID=1682393 RepID=A0A9P8Y753_9PEZI|nr:uncharacterized protein B0I36DRAFT_326123 [Microdochium trichocladiopsis]KAH7029623.1 hypothetical protein B0I36DRAFT_326123 [Microdochium trichocladiopsis]